MFSCSCEKLKPVQQAYSYEMLQSVDACLSLAPRIHHNARSSAYQAHAGIVLLPDEVVP